MSYSLKHSKWAVSQRGSSGNFFKTLQSYNQKTSEEIINTTQTKQHSVVLGQIDRVISALMQYRNESLSEHVVPLVLLPHKVGRLCNWIEGGGQAKGNVSFFWKWDKAHDFWREWGTTRIWRLGLDIRANWTCFTVSVWCQISWTLINLWESCCYKDIWL